MNLLNTLSKSFFLILIIPLYSFAQKPVVEWFYSKEGGPYADVISTNDGGVIYATTSTSSPTTISLTRLNNTGEVIWEKTLGGTNDDVIYSLQKTNDGILFSGYSNSTDGDLTGIPNSGNGWIGKIDTNGNILWQKRYNGIDRINKIISTKDGTNLILATVSTNSSYVRGHHGGNDIWVAKISSEGDTLWTTPAMGGSGQETAIGFGSIQEDTINGGYILTARTTTTNDGDIIFGGNRESSGKFWVVKLNINGQMQWQKRFGGSHSSITEGPKSIVVTKDGKYMISGTVSSIDEDITMPKGGGKNDTWVFWLDQNGEKTKDISYGGTGVDPNQGGMFHTNNGNYLLISQSQSIDGDIDDNEYQDDPNYAPWIAQINSSGEIQWTKYLIIDNERGARPNTAIQLTDGSFIVLSNKWIAKISGCPSTVSLTEKICAGTTYDFNGRILSIAGEYKDTLTTVGGCDSIITLTLEVAPLPTPAITAVQKELSTTTFESYQWLLNNQPLAGANSQTYTPDQSGTYRVITTNENNCSDTSAAFEFNIAGDPFLLRDKYTWKFSIPGMGEQVSDHIFYEDSILYQMAGTAYTTDYKMNKEYFDATEQRWIGVGEGGSIDKTGIYFVLFFKEDRGDSILIYKHECADQAEAYAFPFPAPDATTDHGWNWYVKAGTATSIAAAQELKATIYPNPVADELNISLSNNNAVEVSITTLDGREVLNESFAGRTTIQAGALPQGIYVVRISENGVLKTVQKIVKQ